ncbi:MAG: hypothetical protein WDN66_00955 [Candidatus Saccharibacteria bacterium]
MSKQTNRVSTELKSYTGNIGLGFLSVATVLGMLKMPTHADNRYVLPGQLVKVQSSNVSNTNNPISREREDTNPEYVSYGETQRTPSRSGKY